MTPELRRLLDQLDHLAARVEELRSGIRRAAAIVEADPAMALIRVRKVLEYIVRDLFEKRVGEAPGTRPLENLLQRLLKDDHFPRHLAAYANSIRELGNLGAHAPQERITDADLFRALTMLLPILEWYFGPGPAAAADSGGEPPAAAPAFAPPPERVPWKQAALLDRRLITELTVLLAHPESGAAFAPHLPRLLACGLALYDELLIETTFSSTLQQLIHRENQALGDVLLLIRPPRAGLPEDFLFALDDAAEQWAADPMFQLAAGRYERLKSGSTAAAADAIAYVQHVLCLAQGFDAAILPHPGRWPLLRHVLENCLWAGTPRFSQSQIPLPADPLDGRLKLPETRRQRVPLLAARFGEPAPLPLTLARYGPMPFPFPRGLLRQYSAADLEGFGTFAYELCVPGGQLAPSDF